MNTERLLEILEAVRWEHISCGDYFYSCPIAQDFNNDPNRKCDCGADEANALIDEAVKIVKGE